MAEYKGVYILMEKIKRGKHRVNIQKVGSGATRMKNETTPHPDPLVDVNDKEEFSPLTPALSPLRGEGGFDRGGEGDGDISGGYIFKKDRLNRGENGFRSSQGTRFAFEEPKER